MRKWGPLRIPTEPLAHAIAPSICWAEIGDRNASLLAMYAWCCCIHGWWPHPRRCHTDEWCRGDLAEFPPPTYHRPARSSSSTYVSNCWRSHRLINCNQQKKIILNCNVYISSIDNANDPLYSDEIVGISSGDGFRTIGQFRVFHRFAIGRHHFDVFHGKLFLAMHRELCDQRIEHYLGLGEIGRRGLNEDVLRIQSDLRMIAVDNRWQWKYHAICIVNDRVDRRITDNWQVLLQLSVRLYKQRHCLLLHCLRCVIVSTEHLRNRNPSVQRPSFPSPGSMAWTWFLLVA